MTAGTVALSSAENRPLELSGFTLRVTAGPDSGRTYSCDDALTVVGTHETAQLRLKDPTVSRFHCEILSSEGQVRVRDVGSKNGVLVDGVRIIECVLHPGAVITLGGSKLKFEPGDAPLSIAVSSRSRFGTMVGRSPVMRRVFSLLERAASSNATVLLGGETGTGKEAAAESIHRESERRDGPFVVVDCGAIPPDLLESELFGHEKGSFTGAHERRTGAFEAAHEGTIFLDEVGELGAELQPKLLRVLEKREVKRVGSNTYRPVDTRVIAATNRNLRAEVNDKSFRSDLYYRLAVVEVRLPALRERPEDLDLLVAAIVENIGAAGKPETAVLESAEFRAALLRHSWPGNVRELRNYVERCLALAETAPLDTSAPGDAGGSALRVDISRPLKEVRDRAVTLVEHEYLEQMLKKHEGNVAAAARASGLDRVHFYRLLWRHGLK